MFRMTRTSSLSASTATATATGRVAGATAETSSDRSAHESTATEALAYDATNRRIDGLEQRRAVKVVQNQSTANTTGSQKKGTTQKHQAYIVLPLLGSQRVTQGALSPGVVLRHNVVGAQRA